MLSRIFPKQIDNAYRGHWLAIWLLVAIALLKGTQGVESIINTRNVLTTADGIALDSFSPAGAEVVIALFALLGLYVLLLPLQSVVVLIRYRAMIPFMYLLFLIVQLGSRALALVNPIARPGAQTMGFGGHPIGFYVNLAILAITLVGFVLSLQNKSNSPDKPTT